MKNSKTQMIKLSKVAISLSLFSTLMMPMVVYADKVENLGVATGDNSVAVGQDSIATSTNGIATGHQSVATGGGLSRADFEARKQQYDATIQNINTENANIKQKNQEISDKETEINMVDNTLNNYRYDKQRVDAKKRTYDDLVNQRDAKRDDVNNKTTDVTNAQNALDPFRKNGSSDQYITFFDMLRNLDWSSSKTEDQLAGDLKTNVDNKFNNVFNNYDLNDYKEIVSLYKRREGQISGSRQRLENELSSDYRLADSSYRGDATPPNSSILNLTGYRFQNELIKSYYNDKNNNTNYISDFNFPHIKELLDRPLSGVQNSSMERDYGEFLTKIFNNIMPYDGTSQFRQPNLGNRDNFVYVMPRINNNLSSSVEVKNTLILHSKSQAKANKNQEFTALIGMNTKEAMLLGQNENYIGTYMDSDGYIKATSSLDKNFINTYNQAAYNNYSKLKAIRFGFKSKYDNHTIRPWGTDGGLIHALQKLNNNSTEINDFLDSRDISLFREEYDLLKKYKDTIDWTFNKSAINLTDYQTKLDKAMSYYKKVDDIIQLYNEIIAERQKAGGGDQTILDEKSRRLLGIKKEVFDGLSDVGNFMAGIELEYTPEARNYLEYGKADADRMVGEIVNELRLYDPNEGVIKAVDDKIEALKAEYENAKQAKKNAEDALADLNNQVNANELTPEEKAIDQTISDKEREKQALEEEKARLEKAKQDAQDRLDAARDELSRSNIANLGTNSYAHGFQAFASGDNSIAIGTQALAKGGSSIAMGHGAQANAQDAIAIGRDAVVERENSVAIGNGSRAERGGSFGSYEVPLGDGRKATYELGSTGEFSVGSEGNLRQITHVAAGMADTDAVNVWQLKAAIAAIPRADNNNTGAQPAQPSQPAQPVNVQVYDVSGNTKTQATSLETAINHMNEQGIKYVHVNGSNKGTEPQNRNNGDSSASGVYSVAIGHLANAVGANSVALGDKAESRVDNSVALGADSQTTKEKTKNTLGVGNQRDRDIIDNLNNTVNNYAGNAVGVVSVGQKGKERIIQNVAAGLVGENSTDAVNGSQLHALAQAVGRGETGLVRQSTDAANVQNGVNHNRLTVGSATGGSEVNFANVGGQARRLTGVAEGIEATDAVNKSQLDKAIGQLSSRFEKTEKQLKGGISNVAAMASLPQAYLPSQGMLSVATGYYRGSSSVAVGLSQVSDNGRVVFKLNGSASQKGDFTAGAGIGFAW